MVDDWFTVDHIAPTEEAVLGYRHFAVQIWRVPDGFYGDSIEELSKLKLSVEGRLRTVMVGAHDVPWLGPQIIALCTYSSRDGVEEARKVCANHLLNPKACGCGIYSFKDFDELVRSNWFPKERPFCTSGRRVSTRQTFSVITRVVNSGIIVQGTKGYRSQVADIDEIYLPKFAPCFVCGARKIPSTVYARNQKVVWVCEDGESDDDLFVKLANDLNVWYQAPIVIVDEKDIHHG